MNSQTYNLLIFYINLATQTTLNVSLNLKEQNYSLLLFFFLLIFILDGTKEQKFVCNLGVLIQEKILLQVTNILNILNTMINES